MLLLNINRKPYIGSPMTLSHLTLIALGRSISRSHRFQRLISRKVAELGHMLLLNTNRTPYMGSQKPSLHLSDLLLLSGTRASHNLRYHAVTSNFKHGLLSDSTLNDY